MRLGSMWFVLFVIVLAVLAVSVTKARAPARRRGGFKAKQFMSPNELEFLSRLEAAVPELRFHCQVSMGALLDPETSKREDASSHMSARGRFSQKIVDYVAQDRSTGEVVAVIELDDRTHSAAKDASRDAMLLQANYKVVRWHSKEKPEGRTIREKLFKLREVAVAAADVASVGESGPRQIAASRRRTST